MIKIFEEFRVHSNNSKDIGFDVGDIVYCIRIDDEGDLLEDNKYRVNKIFQNGALYDHKWLCMVKDLGSGLIYGGYYCDRFITEQEYEERKYNL